MTARDFCYWLMGKLEIDAAEYGAEANATHALSTGQVEVIKRHLSLVFAHDLDPKAGGADAQKKLNDLHTKIATGGYDPNIAVRC